MRATQDMVVSLTYELRSDDGALMDQAEAHEPLVYLHGHHGILEGLERALEGFAVGDSCEVSLPADEAYGEYDDDLVQRVPKTVFGEVGTLEVGMRFLADTDQGEVPVEITAIEDTHVVVDGNHPLAGQNLHFAVEVVAIRAATAEELAHGHVHGEHGHLH